MTVLAGIDIGGTKCAVVLGKFQQTSMEMKIIAKERFSTPEGPDKTISKLILILEKLNKNTEVGDIKAVGISCGGPLDSKKGLILSPPNLPGWDKIDIITPFREEFKATVSLQNDANAGALAEWKFGAGIDCSNLIFLTFGTGIGAGLILNGALYTGTNDLAGEVGHIRLADDGPYGHGKHGSFEGFCSGGGIARLAQISARKALENSNPPLFCRNAAEIDKITAKKVGEAAKGGDEIALNIFETVGKRLGQGLALLVDILNPEKIIIGSIYGRQKKILEPITLETLKKEALPEAFNVCQIQPPALGEKIGDYASLSVALNGINN